MTQAAAQTAAENPSLGKSQAFYHLRYLADGRLHSLAHQLEAAISLEPRRVLEIGVGSGIAAAALRSVGVEVTTLDIAESLEPDVVASVTEMPFDDGAFDVANCCEVLEHVPFDEVSLALKEIRRVVRRGLVMSVPDVTKHFDFTIAAPELGRHRLSISVPRPFPKPIPKRKWDSMGHHWEIGYRGYSLGRVKGVMREAGWTIRRTWRVPEKAWHRFFVLEKPGAG
ncbi:MAG: class I SAM-dependent methyltransferase [Planctomycetota bacterium]|nr:class I SAM-dependent methyltransferase [Planctomycetota bacterium]